MDSSDMPDAERPEPPRWLPAILIPTVLLAGGLLCADALARQQPPAPQTGTSQPMVAPSEHTFELVPVQSVLPADAVAVTEDYIEPPAPVADQPNANGNGNGNGNGNPNGGVGNGNGLGNGKHQR